MSFASKIGAVALRWAAITPNDSTDNVSGNVCGIYVGGAGNIACNGLDGHAETFNGVAAGSFLPIIPSRILSTGTTATGMLALYWSRSDTTASSAF